MNGNVVAKTPNDNLAPVSGFIQWLIQLDRRTSNPFSKIGKIQKKGDEKLKRRAFTPDELKRLCSVSEWRTTICLTVQSRFLRAGGNSGRQRQQAELMNRNCLTQFGLRPKDHIKVLMGALDVQDFKIEENHSPKEVDEKVFQIPARLA